MDTQAPSGQRYGTFDGSDTTSSATSRQRTVITLDPGQAVGVQKAIEKWSVAELISSELASELWSTIETRKDAFDWEKVAKYSFRLSVFCFAIAVVSLVFDNLFLKLIHKILEIPPSVRSPLTATVAVAIHVWAVRRSHAMPHQVYRNEAIHGVGAVIFALAAYQLTEVIDKYYDGRRKHAPDGSVDAKSRSGQDHSQYDLDVNHLAMVNLVFLLLATVYGIVGIVAKSNLIWSCGMTALGYHLAWRQYFFQYEFTSLDFMCLYILVGLCLLVAAYYMRASPVTASLWETTRIWGLLYVFVPLWMFSLFGPDGIFWRKKSHLPAILHSENFWAAVLPVAAVASIWHGLYYVVPMTKGFGLTFLCLNIYSMFYREFWDRLFKPIFFTILAISLGLLGRYAESIWNIKMQDLPIVGA